jgi:hypothetical protein
MKKQTVQMLVALGIIISLSSVSIYGNGSDNSINCVVAGNATSQSETWAVNAGVAYIVSAGVTGSVTKTINSNCTAEVQQFDNTTDSKKFVFTDNPNWSCGTSFYNATGPSGVADPAWSQQLTCGNDAANVQNISE